MSVEDVDGELKKKIMAELKTSWSVTKRLMLVPTFIG